jgi:hypothetical protein
LLLGLLKADGIYMSSDYRVTDSRTGKLIDDETVKFLTAHYPPHKTGPKVLFGYTGLAKLGDGTPVGTWIRETLRGESEVIDTSMAHLKSRLNRDIAPMRIPLIINLLVLEPERKLWGGFTNVKKDDTLLAGFEYVMQDTSKPMVFANGSGAFHLTHDERRLLLTQLSVTPRMPMDHMKLLATVNRRVAARDQRVSPFCHVSFIPAKGESGATSHVFSERGESVAFAMPLLLFGIDLTGMAQRNYENFKRVRSGVSSEPIDVTKINDDLSRRP